MKATLTPLRTLLNEAREKHFKRDQLLLYAEDTITEVFILTSGVVKLFDIDDKGQEKILQIIKAPAIIPLDCLFSRPHTIRWFYGALTDVDAFSFSANELHDRIKKNPDLGEYVINWLAIESHELLVRIDGMNKTSAKEKILSVLKFLAVYYSGPDKRGWREIEFPVTHQFLADIAGIARESVSIQMARLQKEKIVKGRRSILKVNDARLLHYDD